MFYRLLNAIVRRRRIIVATALVFFLAGLVFVLVRGNVYEAEALLMPPVEEGGQGILTAWMSRLNIPSVMTPISAGSTSAAILRDILESRRLGEMIVDSLSLRDHYRAGSLEEALRDLRGRTKSTATETGLIRLSVRDRDPEFALRIAGAYIAGLDSLNRFLQKTRADETSRFVAGQIDLYREQLQTARGEIAAFQSSHNIVDFDEQVRGAISVAADIKVRTILAGIERDLMSEFTHPDATELRRKNAEYENLLRQLKNIMYGDSVGAVFVPLRRLPELSQRYAEMQRDLEVNERVYSYLLERYEEAGIEKARTTSVVQIVDAPVLPEEPAGLPRAVLVLIATICGLVWGAVMVCWWEWAAARPKSTEEARALAELRETIASDLTRLRRALRV